ncbi:bis-aminopropyl spermidine synthase family protein [Brevibacillus ruminantium]|uniref:Bis-aminopropyl spermidine synthase family protein n=1 Tax=Brevibacillus ruminantium TaxID=2950604 RepID=A0ABY4WFC1_9BACL|nr:bis-aminopropyl spermidine synthase family protein [Brevibacillus ruminantium]USG64823.1 bis-aminopropyl spermidine synthase family protein [Brevibacillus ruminantium]
MKNYIELTSKQVRLQEGPQAIEKLLLECYLHPGTSTKELARKLLLPVPVTAAIKKELIKLGALRQDRGVSCTADGTAFLEKKRGFDGLDIGLYRKLMNAEMDWREELADILAQLHPLLEGRPQVDVQIDQSKCTPETSLKRAILCLREHALVGGRILCVGDDDLVSVSLGLLLKRLFPQQWENKASITVVDIDERFLRYIAELATREGLPITCTRADLRQPLSPKQIGTFDCFFTDPPYTLPGMSLFVSRGISVLQKKKGLPIYLSFAHKSPEFMLDMQREFIRMGLVVTEVIPHFNEYEGAEMIGNRGQMIVLKTTEQTLPRIKGSFDEALYTGEVKRTLRTYRCRGCEGSIQVGFQQDFPTIERLKMNGCPLCQHDTFDLVKKRSV